MESVYHIVAIHVNETSWAHIWRLRSCYLRIGYDKSPPPPPAQYLHLHPSIEQLELLPSTDRETHQPFPSTHQPNFVTAKDSSSSGFFVFRQKVQNIDKNACRQMFQALEPFRKEVMVDEPSKDTVTVVSNLFKKYQHKEPLMDLGIPGMTVEAFWEDGDKDYNQFEYGKPLVTKQAHAKLMWPLRRIRKWYYLACVCGLQFIKGRVPEVVFKR
jgi:hypothetical protein